MRFLIVFFLATSAFGASPGDRLIGEWRGTSICTDREHAPACKDETTRYVVAAKPDAKDTYHMAADKLVAGSWQSMGEFDLVYSAKDATWTYDFKTRDGRPNRWWFRLSEGDLDGGITDGEGHRLRDVDAKRYEP
jgi:hypothetical protein